MIDLAKYRIIDLSHELTPSERKVDGRYDNGLPFAGRPIDLQEFIYVDGSRMHHIQAQTHLGTHVEAPYKYSETREDVADLPIDTYLGEAAACNFSHKKAGEAITLDDLKQAGVKKGDIVLAWGSPALSGERPYLTAEALDWLLGVGIKSIGIQNLSMSPPGVAESGEYGPDSRVLLAGIGLIDAPTGLDQITKPRVFFIGLPLRMHRVTASWTRAIVLEEL